jgi:RNA polymerase sigma-70 factor (ECF subfamily)
MIALSPSAGESAPAGQPAQAVDLFRSHQRRAFQFALQLLGNADDALDIVQEAFLRVHREWSRRDLARDPAPWLFAIVRNLAIDLLRKRSTRNECGLDGFPETSGAADPESLAISGEAARRLWKEIAALPMLQREALMLRDWHGLSYAQIAGITGSSVAAVTARLHDARCALRKRMRMYL